VGAETVGRRWPASSTKVPLLPRCSPAGYDRNRSSRLSSIIVSRPNDARHSILRDTPSSRELTYVCSLECFTRRQGLPARIGEAVRAGSARHR